MRATIKKDVTNFASERGHDVFHVFRAIISIPFDRYSVNSVVNGVMNMRSR